MSESATNDIEHRFGYHPPKNEATIKEHELVRAQTKGIAHYWSGNLPEGREKSLAITKLEEAMFWANAAIARKK